jgi:hypothetical protein
MKPLKIASLLIIGILLNACSLPVTRVDVQNFGVQIKGHETDKALNLLTVVLIDNGFDIKMTNKDAGVITTEYKKFASLERNPPFDYYMQIKGKLKTSKKGTYIELSPIIKEQNRLNAAASTEHELGYYVGDPHNIGLIRSMRAQTGWRTLAQTLFMNIVNETAKAYHVNFEDVVQNVTKTDANAFGAN